MRSEEYWVCLPFHLKYTSDVAVKRIESIYDSIDFVDSNDGDDLKISSLKTKNSHLSRGWWRLLYLGSLPLFCT